MIYVRVPGHPVPKGSMTGLWSPSAGKVIVKHNSKKLKGWQQDIGWIVRGEMNRIGFATLTGPVDLKLLFWIRGSITSPPDIDKLTRACLDALTGVLYKDDSQVVALHVEKLPGVVNANLGVEIWAKERTHAEMDRL